MSRSRRAVVAFAVLMPGVLAGWVVWRTAYPAVEPVLLGRLGAAGGALALWLLLGGALLLGYGAALWVGSRVVGTRPLNGVCLRAKPKAPEA